MAGPTLRIEAPTRAAREGGLSDVAEFVSNQEIGNAESTVFVSEGCAFPQLEASRCFNDDVPDKQSDGIFINNAITETFTIYAGVRCFAGPEPDYEERAQRALADGQDRVLEAQLALWAAGATPLTAGANVVGALGRVEQDLDDRYVGRGTVLMSRYDATLAAAAGALEKVDGKLQTKLGTPVLATSAVDPGFVHGLGAVLVHHTAVVTTELITPRKNIQEALAEAQFVLAVDCEFRTKSSTAA